MTRFPFNPPVFERTTQELYGSQIQVPPVTSLGSAHITQQLYRGQDHQISNNHPLLPYQHPIECDRINTNPLVLNNNHVRPLNPPISEIQNEQQLMPPPKNEGSEQILDYLNTSAAPQGTKRQIHQISTDRVDQPILTSQLQTSSTSKKIRPRSQRRRTVSSKPQKEVATLTQNVDLRLTGTIKAEQSKEAQEVKKPSYWEWLAICEGLFASSHTRARMILTVLNRNDKED